jgi:hypothetical protein
VCRRVVDTLCSVPRGDFVTTSNNNVPSLGTEHNVSTTRRHTVILSIKFRAQGRNIVIASRDKITVCRRVVDTLSSVPREGTLLLLVVTKSLCVGVSWTHYTELNVSTTRRHTVILSRLAITMFLPWVRNLMCPPHADTQ